MSDPAQLTLSLFEPITVKPTWEILTYGADARARGGRREPLFAHRHIPTRPATVRNDTVWLAMLDLAEDARRYNQASRAVLNLAARDGAASNGPIGIGDLMLDSRGCREWGANTGHASWAQLLAGRRQQRHAEREIAAARDLAEAYHYLDYYGHVYAQPDFLGDDQTVRGGWRADAFIAQLARQVLDLGGEPALLEPRSDYMRAGIRIALEDPAD
jgi:hypothetical protein